MLYDFIFIKKSLNLNKVPVGVVLLKFSLGLLGITYRTMRVDMYVQIHPSVERA